MRISTDHLFWPIALMLLGASLFFTASVTSFKKELNLSATTLEINSGQEARVVKIIDGDEVSVVTKNQQMVVRILGIFSFDPTVNDPGYQNIAQSAFSYLKNELLDRKIKIVFDEFKKDSSNRLLAYLQKENLDIGKEMISKGLTLVYIKYPFSRLDEYIAVEESAIVAKTGLWRDPDIAWRSIQLKNKWHMEAEKE
ncbi:MAG: thermonuclease family protein [Deltaproteobacteria bacterium]|nr:thermonuclease family protein [Deltaproteobacteria bacterium]